MKLLLACSLAVLMALSSPASGEELPTVQLSIKGQRLVAEALLNLGHVRKSLGQEEEARICWTADRLRIVVAVLRPPDPRADNLPKSDDWREL